MIERDRIRYAIGCRKDEIMMLSVGELSVRKNHEVVIKALAMLKKENSILPIRYYIVGQGLIEDHLRKLIASENLDDCVQLLGFRSDIVKLLNAADLFIFPSLQEGLPVALMEAMANGLPCIASEIRGNVDLIENEVSGFLCNPTDTEAFVKVFYTFVNNKIFTKSLIKFGYNKIMEFDISLVKKEMSKIYTEIRTRRD